MATTIEDLKLELRTLVALSDDDIAWVKKYGNKKYWDITDKLIDQAYQAAISHCAEAVRLKKIKYFDQSPDISTFVETIKNGKKVTLHLDTWNQACDDLAAKIAEVKGKK